MKRKIVYETAIVSNNDPSVFMKEINEYYLKWQKQGYEIDTHFSASFGSYSALLEKIGYVEGDF